VIAMRNDTQAIRDTLDDIHRTNRAELATIPLAAAGRCSRN
jgi:hypothetical protein